MLHCADLHSPIMEPEQDRHLADLISAEFEAQEALERAGGLPVSVMKCSRPCRRPGWKVRVCEAPGGPVRRASAACVLASLRAFPTASTLLRLCLTCAAGCALLTGRSLPARSGPRSNPIFFDRIGSYPIGYDPSYAADRRLLCDRSGVHKICGEAGVRSSG